MTDKELATTLVSYGVSYAFDKMTAEQATEYAMRDIAAIRAECARREAVLLEALRWIASAYNDNNSMSEAAAIAYEMACMARAVIEGGQDAN